MSILNKKVIFTIAILLILIIPVGALQQTSGALSINITQGEQGFAKYGIKNEENQTTTVKLSANGSIENYINYPKELTLKPDEFVYVDITTNISSNYKGSRELNGTIYALKEGEKGGQVQLNIRLGKRIQLSIAEQEADQTGTLIINWIIIGSIIVISLIIIVIKAMNHKGNNKTYRLKESEVE